MKVCSTIWANFIPCAFVARSSSTVRQCPVSALIGLASVFKVHSSIQSHTGSAGLASTSASAGNRRAVSALSTTTITLCIHFICLSTESRGSAVACTVDFWKCFRLTQGQHEQRMNKVYWCNLEPHAPHAKGSGCFVPREETMRRITISKAMLGVAALLFSVRMAAATEITWPSFQWSEPNNAPVMKALKKSFEQE